MSVYVSGELIIFDRRVLRSNFTVCAGDSLLYNRCRPLGAPNQLGLSHTGTAEIFEQPATADGRSIVVRLTKHVRTLALVGED